MEKLSLYQRVLGDRYQQLHPLLQEVHSSPALLAEGSFRISRPKHWFPRFLGTILGMPAAEEDVPTTLAVQTVPDGSEKWLRNFGKFQMTTWQWAWRDLLLERSGPVTFGIYLKVADSGMSYVVRKVWVLGIPLPLFIAPSVLAIVTPIPHGWHAKVELKFPLLGKMLGYVGEFYPNKSTTPCLCTPS
jgi:hypothetical protein